jgi:two-component system, NtrC family, response regulator AtoC
MTTAIPGCRVLLVDDDVHLGQLLATDLGARGIEVIWRPSAAEALEHLATMDVDVVVTDIEMDGLNGLELCERLVAEHRDVPVLIMTGHGDFERAISAIRAGAFDFIQKPVDLDLLAIALERALRDRRLNAEVSRLRREVETAHGFGEMLYASPPMCRLGDMLERVAASDASVLVSGESGTGKELVARALHRTGSRRDGPFIAINCAAVPEALLESELFGHVRGAFTDARTSRVGLFVQAHGGTLFLDEICDTPLALQPKLLRVLQEHAVRPVGGDAMIACDVRIISATNQDLERAVERGRFREDLYFRVNVIQVNVPPLRARGTDVLLLARHFIDHFASKVGKPIAGLTAAAAERLQSYAWPGNVRELENCIEAAVTLARGSEIGVGDLPVRIRRAAQTDAPITADDPNVLLSLDEVERRHILRVLDAVRGSRTMAARTLGLDRKTLYRKLLQYRP